MSWSLSEPANVFMIGLARLPDLYSVSACTISPSDLPANAGFGFTPSPFAPWHPAHALALALPACASPAACAVTKKPSNAQAPTVISIRFISSSLIEVQSAETRVSQRHIDSPRRFRARPQD